MSKTTDPIALQKLSLIIRGQLAAEPQILRPRHFRYYI